MPCSDRILFPGAIVAGAIGLGAACSVPLHEHAQRSGQTDASTAPVENGCALFRRTFDSVSGAARSFARDDGSTFWILDGASGASNVGVHVAASASTPSFVPSDDCLSSSSARTPSDIVDRSRLPANSSVSALSVASTSNGVWLFYTRIAPAADQPFGVKTDGFGVAPFDEAMQAFVPSSSLLWSSDRPAFGTSVVVRGEDVFVYGCRSTGFLRAQCWIARTKAASIDDEKTYAYYAGGGHWTSDWAGAFPIVDAGNDVDVVWNTTQNRFVMIYVPPLGSTIEMRSGIAPEGPWSDPIDVATCDLADPSLFCAGVHAHPSLSTDRSLVVTHSIATFDGDALARFGVESLWPRLVSLSVPNALP